MPCGASKQGSDRPDAESKLKGTHAPIALNEMRTDGEKGERSPSGLAATSPSVRAFIYLYGRLRLIWRQFLRRSISSRSFSQIRSSRSVLVCAWACLRRGEAEPLSYQDKPTHRCQRNIKIKLVPYDLVFFKILVLKFCPLLTLISITINIFIFTNE